MTDPDEQGGGADVYAAEQAAAHRRGFVLGLTLAESILLLTFVVLLLLVVGFVHRESEAERLRAEVSTLKTSLERLAAVQSLLGSGDVDALEEDLRILTELKREAVERDLDWDSSFIELVKVTIGRSSAEAENAARSLADKEAEFDKALERLGAGVGPAVVAAEAVGALAESKGRVRELSRRIGGDLPSCWRTSDDKPEFIFDVVLDSDGIRVRERVPAERLPELRTLMGSEIIDPTESLTVDGFLSRTRKLYDYSVRNECRFYVVVYDATGAEEKEHYKNLLRAVEGHFYKRQDDGRASF